MSFRDILVFLDEGGASEGRLQLATKIAQEHGAYLSAVFLQNGHADRLATALGCAVARTGRGAPDRRRGRYVTHL